MSAAEMALAAPEVEVVAKASRRRFTMEYKRKIVREADGCKTPGAVGALLRREGLYTSHLAAWRKQRKSGALKEYPYGFAARFEGQPGKYAADLITTRTKLFGVEATSEDATRLAVAAQLRAGVDVVSDGEQRRDNYASFVGARLDNCQLIPLTDLLPLVDDPAKFEREMQSLDVPASDVRHPALFGPLGRSRPLAVHELQFARVLTDGPVKVALPGPYLLTRTMWMECISDRAYRSREHLAEDIVRVLREEVHDLLAAGATLVQLDEPVLSEVVFTGAKNTRSFMCGALSEKGDPGHELVFATELINQVVSGLPRDRLGLHVCRGNWTRDERAALAGDYRPLLSVLQQVEIGTLFLELCTPRAGEIDVLKDLPASCRIGVGVVNQKLERVETPEEIGAVLFCSCTSSAAPESSRPTPDCSPPAAVHPLSGRRTSGCASSRMGRGRKRGKRREPRSIASAAGDPANTRSSGCRSASTS